MKFLDIPQLNNVIELLSKPLGGMRLDVKLEAYSCKMVVADKKMFKELSANMPENPRLSGPQLTSGNESGGSPKFDLNLSGEMSEGATQPEISIRTLSYLIGTLNQIFPDNDFIGVNSTAFCRETGFQDIQSVFDDRLERLVFQYSTFRQDMWNILDKEIDIKNCDLYSYDYKTDSFFSNCLWNINVFFFNKALHRIVFFSASYLTDSPNNISESDGISNDCEEYGFYHDG